MLRNPRRRPRAFVPEGLAPLEGRALLSTAAVSAPTVKATAVVRASGARVISSITYTRLAGGRQLDLYVPGGSPPPGGWPLVMAFPGGGWRSASRKDYGGAVRTLNKYGFAVAGVDYAYGSGAPGSKIWPLNFQTAQDAVRFLRDRAGKYGLDPNRFAAMGESAGGHIASLLGTYPQGPISSESPGPDARGPGRSNGQTSARVQAVVNFYGPTDLTTLFPGTTNSGRTYINTFLGGNLDQIPGRYAAASPTSFVSSDDPPFYIAQGERDFTVVPSQAVELSQALTKAGVPNVLRLFPGFFHGFRPIAGKLNLYPEIADFLRKSFARVK